MNKRLEQIYKEDQQDRVNPVFFKTPIIFRKRDEKRRWLVEKMIKENKIKTGRDFYIAAMIFHHGHKIIHAKKAIKLAQKSTLKRYGKARWLFAAATDRLLTKQEKKQKYGTQFFKKSARSKVILLPVDKNTTDKERAYFNVPPLAEIKKSLIKLNRKK